MSRRILDETTKSVFASDDYLYMDSATDGATKITPDNLVRNTTVAQQLAQHIADAEDDVEQITSDIEDIQTDLSDLRSDLGDLSELDTTDKSSIVNAINEVASDSSGSGLTADIKTALLQIAQKVAYIDDDGQDYYDDLYDALYAVTAISLNTNSISLQSIGATSQLTATTTPAGGNVTWSSSNTSVATVSSTGLVTSVAYGSATITATAGSVSATCSVVVAQATCTGITATYTQSGTVYDTDTLDSLKTDLVVTASWSNGTTSTLADTDYTLSGTLAEGTSTITVTYGGKTATFTVTVDVDSSLTTSAYITVANETLTDGYINDNGEVTSASNNYFIDKYYNALPIAITNGDDIERFDIIRTAYYDTNYSFISRDYQQGGSYIKEVSESSAVYEKIGWQGTAPTFICLLNDAMDNSLFVNAGKTLDSSGNLTDESIQNTTDLLPIDNGCDKWFIYSNNANNTIKIAFYDSSGNFIIRVYKSNGYACGDIPATAVYYRVSKGTNFSTTYHVLMKGI